MYAIVRSGSKQYRVAAGDTIEVERLAAPVGEQVTLSEVLLVGGDEPRVGTPLVEKASVVGTVVAQSRERKLRVFKYKRRKHYRRTHGHRRAVTTLRIEEVRA